uniref:DUF4806 domain-containing protein n=2 Tax=Iconisemion striatum TaxID=60296 RepID=A0A1A7XER4_9TELE
MDYMSASSRTRRRRINVRVQQHLRSLALQAVDQTSPYTEDMENKHQVVDEDEEKDESMIKAEQNVEKYPSVGVEGSASHLDFGSDSSMAIGADEEPNCDFFDLETKSDAEKKLAEWAANQNVSHSVLSGLLPILVELGLNVPKDPRTLLSTLKDCKGKPMGRESCYHFSRESAVLSTSPAAQSAASPTCEAMFSKVLSILEEVKETQRVHSRMLNALLQPKDGSAVEVPEGVDLPLETQEDVEDLNARLEDRKFMSSVVAMVADTGGTSVDDATRRMMKRLISPELALEYNMFGRHGKKKFRDLRLFNVVYESLKKNALTSKVNLQEAEKALSKWFTGARDRGGLRAARIQNRITSL